MENLTLQDVRTLVTVSPDRLLEAVDAHGRTALHWAVINKRFDVANALVAFGANPLKPDKFGKTPMDYADRSVLKEREWRLRTSVIAQYWKRNAPVEQSALTDFRVKVALRSHSLEQSQSTNVRMKLDNASRSA